MKYTLILLSVILLSGCSQDAFDANEVISRTKRCLNRPDSSFVFPGLAKTEHSLFCDNGNKAKLVITRRKLLKYEVGMKVYWQGENCGLLNRRFYPHHIAQKLKPYTRDDSAKKLTYKEYDSFFQEKLSPTETDQTVIQRKYLSEAFEEGSIEAEKINNKYYIVCLDPLVAVVLNDEYISWNRIFSYMRDILYLRKKDGFLYRYDPFGEYRGRVVLSFNLGVIASSVALPYGLDYGLEMPYVENPRWFSPDMKVKDQPVEMISEGKGRIKVDWGYLYLTKQKDKWIVTAENIN